MGRGLIFLALLILAFGYTFWVYTEGTESSVVVSKLEKAQVKEGKRIFQQYNCMACHQVYGLGGYLGPDLTTAWSDKHRGEAYMRAMLQTGGSRMPDFHFTPAQIEALLSYLSYVDKTATTQSPQFPGK